MKGRIKLGSFSRNKLLFHLALFSLDLEDFPLLALPHILNPVSCFPPLMCSGLKGLFTRGKGSSEDELCKKKAWLLFLWEGQNCIKMFSLKISKSKDTFIESCPCYVLFNTTFILILKI